MISTAAVTSPGPIRPARRLVPAITAMTARPTLITPLDDVQQGQRVGRPDWAGGSVVLQRPVVVGHGPRLGAEGLDRLVVDQRVDGAAGGLLNRPRSVRAGDGRSASRRWRRSAPHRGRPSPPRRRRSASRTSRPARPRRGTARVHRRRQVEHQRPQQEVHRPRAAVDDPRQRARSACSGGSPSTGTGRARRSPTRRGSGPPGRPA
jgi:hypothetical protein